MAIPPVGMHIAAGVNEVLVVEDEADVYDVSLFVMEEGQIPQSGLSRGNGGAAFDLLGGVSGQLDPLQAIDGLGESGTIDAPGRSASP